MSHWSRAAILAALVSVTAMPVAADAQVLTRPQDIGYCLCQEERISKLDGDMKSRQTDYERKKRAFEDLTLKIDSTRPNVNVDNEMDTESFRLMLMDKDEREKQLQETAFPAYQQSVERYNEAVAAFGPRCAGRAYDTVVLRKVRETLFCQGQ
ncbi:MAG: hypothetical protein K2Q10_05900 [Rhodospirillales bacterium]|nr:hypothetical protein [Rhodospirillales bacterium]